MFSANNHIVTGLDPVADAFSGTVVSDIVNLSQYGSVAFVVFYGVGATGTSTITVEACDDVVPTNVSAIPFHYRRYTSADTEGAITAAAAAGVATTAGSSQRYVVEVSAQALAASGYKYVRLKMVEVVDSPVLGGILIILGRARYSQAAIDSAVV